MMDFRLSSVTTTGHRLKRSWRPDGVAVACVILLVVGFGMIRLRFWHLRHPVLFDGDVGVVLEYIKNALQNGGTTVDPQIGYPDRASLAAFPVFDALSAGVLKILSLFTADPITGANLLAYTDHVLSGVVGYVCLRVLHVPRIPAVAGAVAFAWVEFGLQPARVINHETLQLFAPLAVGATIALLPAARPELTRRGWAWAGVFGAAALVGCAQPYWIAFSIIAMASSAIGCIAAERYRGAALLGTGAAAMVSVAAVCLLWPRFWGEPGLVIHRSPFEQPIYGLKLVNLLLPARSALFPDINRLYATYLANSAPVEGYDAFVGWAGLLGLAFAAVLLLRLPFRQDPRMRFAAAETAAMLIVVLMLFTQVYGLGELFNMLITPEIRAQNRVSPMIAFLAIFVFADAMRRLGGAWPAVRRGATLAVPLVVAIGLYDESAGIDYAALQAAPGTVGRWDDDRAAAQALSDALPPGAKILQWPVMVFPESAPIGRLGSYGEIGLALFTKGFRYSFGSSRGGASPSVAPSSVAAAVEGAAFGFDELVIYKAAYPEGVNFVAQPLREALGLDSNIDTTNIAGFDLRPLQRSAPPLDPAAIMVRVDWDGRGFSGLEHNPDPVFTFRWDDSADASASVMIDNPSLTAVPMRFCGTVVPGTPGAYQVTVNAPGRTIRPPLDPAGTPLDVAFDAPPGRSMLSVAMAVPRLATAPADPRHLHFQVRSPSLIPASVRDRMAEITARLGEPLPATCP